MKIFRILVCLVAVIASGAMFVSCDNTPKLPVDVQYDIVAIGDYKTMESSRPEITFTADGRFHGTTGCNRYFGEYTVEGNAITIADNMGMTRMFCPESDSQEQLIADQLPRIAEFDVKGDDLTLTTTNGQVLHCVKSAVQPVFEEETEEKEPETAVEKAYNPEL
ncbi:MAG: META domain-containing protein [Flavobacteriales bacterium]|nr:META domain-containing protein [Flavobacteriales bacterium]